MAKNKKTVVVYTDWIGTFDQLTDEEAGRLIKHFFRYVNDQDPQSPDRLTQLMFEPLKQQLKRDLSKWEEKSGQNRDAAALGNLKRWNPDIYDAVVAEQITIEQGTEIAKRRKTSQGIANATKPIANATKTSHFIADNDNDNDNDILLKKETKDNKVENSKKNKAAKFCFKTALLDRGFSQPLVDDWLLVRKNKRATNSETAFNLFVSQFEKAAIDPDELLKILIDRDWKGFRAEWLKEIQEKQQKISVNGTNTIKPGQSTNHHFKPAAVDKENLLRELAEDFTNGNIPGQY